MSEVEKPFSADDYIWQMDLWRKAADLSLPLAPEIRSHMIERRGEILQRLERRGREWQAELSKMDRTDEVERARVAVDEFVSWAVREIRLLLKINMEAALDVLVDERRAKKNSP